MTYFAFPHLFGCRLEILDPVKFAQEYQNQGNIQDEFVLTTPNYGTLMVWAESCLGLDAFHRMRRLGGWSPFRSGEVSITKHNGEKHALYYKLGDNGDYDFAATIEGRNISIQPWLKTVGLFAELALNLYVRKCEEDMSHPHLAVRKMLHAEWGESDNNFASLLRQKGFDPKMLDQMVYSAWQRMIKLPLPAVFTYTKDEDVMMKIVEMSQNALRK
jgi:hypothetical protein